MRGKANKINTPNSRRRAHYFFLPHQLLFFKKNNLKQFSFLNNYIFWNFFFNIKNPVWVVEFLVFKDPVAFILG